MYITSQIKCSIRRNIFNNNIKKYDEKEKTKEAWDGRDSDCLLDEDYIM